MAGASEARLKWPNDVWIGSRKLSGCIVDGSASSNYILVGVGINVNQVVITARCMHSFRRSNMITSLPIKSLLFPALI
jgi:biotin-(acetyl-CoA carboxylase) ligase